MEVDGKTIWQVAAGDGERDYAGVCLASKILLVGPGNEGPWPDCEERLREAGATSKRIGMLKRFCETLQPGDLVVLHVGAKVYGVGEVTGDYVWDAAYANVQGWHLQHTRKASWARENLFNPRIFPARTLKWGDTVQQMINPAVIEWMQGLEVGATPEEKRALANSITGGWGGSDGSLKGPRIPGPTGSIGSDDPLVETLTTVLGRGAFRCGACGVGRRLWIGPDGPFLQCTNPRCEKKEVVAAAPLAATLQELNVKCPQCGSATQVIHDQDHNSIACANYPDCSYTATWQEARKSLR